MPKKPDQHALILKHLRAGEVLTGLDALNSDIRTMKLSSRIGEIERDGKLVKGESIFRERVKTESGKVVMSYKLIQEEKKGQLKLL